MTQPIHASVDEEGQRIYFNDEKKKFFSVTRLLSETLPKQMFLVPWAAKVVAEAAAEAVLDADVIEMYYTSDGKSALDFDDDAFANDLKQAWKWQRDDAGELGDEVHEAAEQMLRTSKGKPHIFEALLDSSPRISEQAQSRLRHLLAFLRSHHVSIEDVEFTVFNESLGYAGSCDIAAYVDGVPHFIDIKTSRDVHDETALQITAYARGEYVLTDDGKRATMPLACEDKHLIRGGILHLTPKACKFIEVDITDEMYDCLNALCLVKTLWVDGGRKDALCDVLYDSSKEGL